MTDILRKAFAIRELKLEDSGAISFAFAQLNVVDRDGDVTIPGAFPAKEVPMSAYGHTSWDGALPVGKGTIAESGDWAVFTGQMFMDTTAGRDTHATIKALGPLAEYSYGYQPTEYSYGEQDGKQVRFLKQLDVFEVAPVLRGAGIGTHTLAIKSGAPEAGAPLADVQAWYAGWLPAHLDRIKSHAAARALDGRKLSAADRTALEELVASLDSHLKAARDLITADAPLPKAFDVTALVLAEEARRLGVPV